MTQTITNSCNVAVLIGRFQPFHLGHQALLEQALATAPRVVVVIGSAFQARTPRNPFTWQERKDTILKSLPAEAQARVTCVPMRDFHDTERWSQAVRQAAEAIDSGPITLVGHFKDDTSDYLAGFTGWRLQALSRKHTIDGTAITGWFVEDFTLAKDGRHLAFVTNEDGISKLHLLSLPGHEEVALPELPIGVIGNFGFSPDGKRLALTLNSATSPSDVYVVDLADARLVRWTRSEVGGLDASRFRAPELVRFPTFDEVDGKPRTIPAFYYRPEGDGPFPVVVSIHGGPESQAFPTFNPSTQFLLNELKVAVLVPNVRGSAGYGKNYLQLDNGLLRKDSVKDIGALLDWIGTRPELDADRVEIQHGAVASEVANRPDSEPTPPPTPPPSASWRNCAPAPGAMVSRRRRICSPGMCPSGPRCCAASAPIIS